MIFGIYVILVINWSVGAKKGVYAVNPYNLLVLVLLGIRIELGVIPVRVSD
jgi:hypothetical protein